jgi:hypothetical protein
MCFPLFIASSRVRLLTIPARIKPVTFERAKGSPARRPEKFEERVYGFRRAKIPQWQTFIETANCGVCIPTEGLLSDGRLRTRGC